MARPVMIMAGGTGGHVFPALAVAAELQRRGCAVSFLGTAHGLEARLVPQRGISFTALAAKPVVGRGPLARAAALWTVARSSAAARGVVLRAGAQAVVGTGGYASAPGVLGARLARRPVFLMEVNAHAGAANHWLSRFAAGAAVALEETAGELRCPAWATGVPVRPEFFAVPELAAATLSAAPRLLVLGGSQGARALNRALPAAIAALRVRYPGLRVVHQSGALLLEETLAAYREAGSLDSVEVLPFLEDVAVEMGRAHLVVARAGAMTLAELQAAGRPALLLPLSIAAGHQVDNARAQERAGAAEVLLATEATSERLATALGDLLADAQRLQTMARSARALARPGAAAAIADRLEQVVAGEARS